MITLRKNQNKLRGIFVSDIHFGMNKDSDHLYLELETFLLSLIDDLGEELDFVIIGGDLYDKEVGMNEKAGRLASKLVLTINNKSMENNFFFGIIKGTLRHDYNQLEVFRKLELLNPNFRIFNKTEMYSLDPEENINFLMIPEEYVEDYNEYFLNEIWTDTEEGGRYDFIFAHGTFDFAGYVSKLCTSEKQVKNAVTFKSKQFKDLTYGATISGHIHIKTEDEENKIYYPGSFSRGAFGEESSKGFYYIEYNLNTLEAKLEFIENTLAPTYMTIDGDMLPKDLVEKTKYLQELKETYDHIRIKSTKSIHNDEDLKILQEYAEKDDDIKVEIKKLEDEETEEDKTFAFITNRELELPDTVSKYIEIKTGEKISPKDIIDIISE